MALLAFAVVCHFIMDQCSGLLCVMKCCGFSEEFLTGQLIGLASVGEQTTHPPIHPTTYPPTRN